MAICVTNICTPPDPPAHITSPATGSVNENAVLAHALTADETVTWEIFGGADAAKFEIVGSTLRWIGNGVKDFENPDDANGDNVYLVTITAYDAGLNPTHQSIAITVLDVDDVPPTITSPTSVSVAENATLAHTLTANEPVTWALVGGADQARFELAGNVLRWAGNITKDFEAPDDSNLDNAYVVIVRATDTAGNPNAQTVTVTVTDVQEIDFGLTFVDGTNVNTTLSDGNLGLKSTANSNSMAIASAGWKSSGKWYFEAKVVQTGNGDEVAGIAAEGAVMAQVVVNQWPVHTAAVRTAGGTIQARGFTAVPGANLGATPLNDVLCFAVDLTNWRFWARRTPTGNWNNNAAANPATNVGGINISYFSQTRLAPMGAASTSANKWLFNFGMSAFAGVVPAGFTPGWSKAVETALGHPTYAYLTTSTDALGKIDKGERLFFAAIDSFAHVGVANFKNSGKFYIECEFPSINFFANEAFGFVTNDATSAQVISSGSNCSYVTNRGGIQSNNADSGRSLGVRSVEDVLGAAINLDTGRVWYRVSPSGLWNGQAIGLQNPELNIGGVAINLYYAKTMGPAIFGLFAGNQTSRNILNLGQRAFVGAVPAGFTPGWPLATVAPTTNFTTWNPVDKHASVALSNGNLTADASPAGGYAVVRGMHGKTSGKYYIEGVHNWSGNPSANLLFGIASASHGLNQYLGSSGQSGGLDGAGNIQGVGGGSDGDPATGDIISLAVDVDNKLVWWRVQGGNWNGSAANSPMIAAGGKSFSGFTGPVFPAYNGGFGEQKVFTVNFGDSPFVFPVPAGFTAGWPKNPNAILTTLDANGVVAGGVTITVSSSSGGARATNFIRSSGKYYFEVLFTAIGGASTGAGLTATGVNSNVLTSSVVDCLAIYKSGNIWIDGVNSGASLGAFTNGQLVGFAIDWDNDRAWLRLGASGNWNGSGTANPATNTGGLSITGLPDGCPAGYCQIAADVMTFNFGLSAFAGIVPAGFTAGWT